MSDIEITAIEGVAAGQVAAEIEDRLLASLASINRQTENAGLVLTIVARDGRLRAGFVGSTSYGWLLVKILWVDESDRLHGFGARLLADAERRAFSLGCHGAWVDTSNPAARDFYLHQGYSDFGRLENRADEPPAEHRRWFMQKALRDPRPFRDGTHPASERRG